MSRFSVVLLLGIALSDPASAADADGLSDGRRLVRPVSGVTLWEVARPLDARGPGALFSSVEAAVLDALTYAHLQARESNDMARMRGGTIYRVGDRYSYGEIHLANPLSPHRISYVFGPEEVARFHVYPVHRDVLVNRANERLSRRDRRSVSVIDPLHRPLYVLHPSLAVRAYRGEGPDRVEVGGLRHREREPLFADN